MKNKVKFLGLIFVLAAAVVSGFAGIASAADLYGCKAGNGVYACVTDPNASNCPRPVPVISNSCWCGKNQSQIDSQCLSASGTMFGCKASNGIYACSSDKNASTISACQPVEEIKDSCWCGKNQADINSKCTTKINIPATDKFYNPLPEEELTHMFLFIAKGFLGIVGIWAVIFIIVGGFRMVIAAGDEEALTKAKKTVTWAVIGVIVAALSFSIIAIVQNLLNADIKQTATQTNNSTNNGN